MRKLLFLFIVAAIFMGCKSIQSSGEKKDLTLSGRVEKRGMTTFQYGTHLITWKGKVYALKSRSINLDLYVEKQVTIKGIRVEGYPVENGPELIEVREIK